MGRSSFQQRMGYRDAEIEYLESERDRLQNSLHDTRERFHRFMRDSRQFAFQMRDRLNERRRLDLQYSILNSLEKITDPSEAAEKVLEILGYGLGMDLGISWLVDGATLRCDGFWRPPGLANDAPEALERACRDSVFRRGEALPGRAWAQGGAVWAGDLEMDGEDPRSGVALSEGLHSAVAFPVGNSGGTLLVMELFGREIEAPDEGLIRTLTILGSQVAQVIERRQAEVALAKDLENTRLLRDLSMRHVSEGGIQGLYDEIMDAAIVLTRADAGTVQIFDDETRELVLISTQGFGRNMAEHFHRVNAGSNTSCGIALAKNERSFIAFDVPEDEDPDGSMRMHVEAGYLSAQSTPLITRSGRSIGMVSTHWREHHRLTERELRFLDLLARQAADLIEQWRAEEALHESEERFRHFAENSEDVLWILDAGTGQLEYLSPAFEKVWGEPRDAVLQDLGRWRELVHPEDRERAGEGMARLLGGETFAQEYRIVRPEDGEVRWILDTGFPITYDSWRIKRVAGIAQDITVRKRAEEERGRLWALEAGVRAQRAERRRISRDLHDRVAHDMAVAHQALQLYEVLKEDNPEWAARKLATAQQTVRSALDATRNLSSELWRPAAEESLEDALREFVDTYVPEEIETVFLFDGDESSVPDKIRGQTYLILREAVRNALKHSGCHSLKVVVEVMPGVVRGSVGDDGCGFEPEGDRDGVGLKSMRERTALLGGDLRVVSGNGEGTRVEVYVPLARSGEEG